MEKRKYDVITQLQKTYNATLITYVSEDCLSYSHIPDFYRCLSAISRPKRLALYLSSCGGDIDAAYKIVSLCRESCEHFSVIIPFMAKSAATLIALGADEIIMGPAGELGPLDPQLSIKNWSRTISAGVWSDYLTFVETNCQSDLSREIALNSAVKSFDPWSIGNCQRLINAAKQYSFNLALRGAMRGKPDEKVWEVVDFFTDVISSHSYVIDRRQAKALGLNVVFTNDQESSLIWELFEIYCEEMEKEPDAVIIEHLATLSGEYQVQPKAATPELGIIF